MSESTETQPTNQITNDDLDLLAKLMNALEGKSPNPPDEIITSLTNPHNILERTRFPTHPILQKNVYLRLVALKHPELSAFKQWANYEAEAMISYKGEGRKEWVEQRRNATLQEQGTVIGSLTQGSPQVQPKRRFWQRGEKQEKSEFVNQ
ncbi:MAG TPA: hypothetical protein VKA34_03175 [Balneolales bacterium]|nr:hypothetical protein [Balneolales bacterium]